jgi:phage tail sheath protein FI
MATYQRPGVYINERLIQSPIPATGNANAAGAVLGEFQSGPDSVTLVTSWYEFSRKFGGYNNSYPTTLGIGQFFQNGGSELYVKRVLADDASFAGISVPNSVGEGDALVINATSRGIDGNNLRVQFTAAAQPNYFNIVVTRETVAGTSSDISNDIILERFTDVVLNNPLSGDYVESVVNLQSEYIRVSQVNNDAVPSGNVLPLVGGTDGTEATEVEYSEDVQEFSAVQRPLVLFLPGLISTLGPTNAATVYNSCVAWAENNNGFVVAETAGELFPAEAITYAGQLTESSHVAVYYPHFFIRDPLGRSPQSIRKIGPSGAVAGLYLDTDKTVGPFKAPAGIGASIRGALALERAFTPSELDSLNSSASPVNALRNIPGAGIVSMGARTLRQDGTANRYVNMRRSLIYIRENLNNLTEFALFENNDERLWSRLRAVISIFLNEYRNAGGLRGATEAEAFFVKIDNENNPQSAIEQGQVNIEVGVALQYPAEFVVINLTQKTNS